MNEAIRPDHVWIGPHHFDIIYDEATLGLRTMDDGQQPAWGLLSFKDGAIYLDPRRPESGVRSSLVHEILHGVWQTVGLPNGDLGGYNEELVVNALGEILSMVLRMNPNLLDYMTATDDDT